MNEYHFGYWYEFPENDPAQSADYLLAVLCNGVGESLLAYAIGSYEYDDSDGNWGRDYWRDAATNNELDYGTVVAFMPLPRHPLERYPPLNESMAALREAIGEEGLARLADIPPRPYPSEVPYQ